MCVAPQHRRARKEAQRQYGPDFFGLGDGKGWYVLFDVADKIGSSISPLYAGVTAPIIGSTSIEKLKDNIGKPLCSILSVYAVPH